MIVLEVRTLETFPYYYLVNKINKHTYSAIVLEVHTLETFRCYYYLVNKINKHTYLTHILCDCVRGSHFRNIPLLFGKQNKQTHILNTHTVRLC